jgi:hypothetical protein
VWCSQPTRLDKNRTLEWKASTFRGGDRNDTFKTFSHFEIAQASGKWASIPSPEEDYTTGTGGWVFTSISCGSGTEAPSGQAEDVVTATFRGTRTWKRPLVPGKDWLVKQVVRGKLEIGGEIMESRGFSTGRRQILNGEKGNPSGSVRVVDHYRRCRDAACDVRRIFKRTTWFRMGNASAGTWVLSEQNKFRFEFKPQRIEHMRLFAGTVTPHADAGLQDWSSEALAALRRRDRSSGPEGPAVEPGPHRREGLWQDLRREPGEHRRPERQRHGQHDLQGPETRAAASHRAPAVPGRDGLILPRSA